MLCCKVAPTPPPTGGSSGSQTVSFSNPLKFDTVQGLLGQILTTLQQIIVTLSLVFLVIGAVMYIVSAGNTTLVGQAKGAITASMVGLALGLAAPSFLKEISDVLGWKTVDTTVSGAKSLSEIALGVLNFLLSIVGVLGIIMLVVGGLMFLTSAGDQDRIDTGKDIFKYALLGIFISLASLVLVTAIAGFFVSSGA